MSNYGVWRVQKLISKFAHKNKNFWPCALSLAVSVWALEAHWSCSALRRAEFFIEPPPDTQRKERQGERGIWVAVSCYLLHVTPLPSPTSPPPPTPRICRTACGHIIRISWQRETPPPHTPHSRIIADSGSLGQNRGRPPFRSL
jgi:hypothetical protein